MYPLAHHGRIRMLVKTDSTLKIMIHFLPCLKIRYKYQNIHLVCLLIWQTVASARKDSLEEDPGQYSSISCAPDETMTVV